MLLPRAVINNVFDVQPSAADQGMSHKEKEILWSSQEESGEETERFTIIVPCLIYVKRLFTFQKAFSMGLVHRYAFGRLGSTL